MDSLTLAYTAIGVLLGIGAIVKGVIPSWHWLRSATRRVGGALDNIGGRDPYVDPATGKYVEGIAPIGERFTVIETALLESARKLDALGDTTQRLDAMDSRFANHELRLDEHETHIAQIIANTFERGAETALKAVEKAAEE